MERRTFIKNTTVASTFLALGGVSLQSFSKDNLKKITILHTNDVHSTLIRLKATTINILI